MYLRTRYRSKLGWFFWFGPIHVTRRRNLDKTLRLTGWVALYFSKLYFQSVIDEKTFPESARRWEGCGLTREVFVQPAPPPTASQAPGTWPSPQWSQERLSRGWRASPRRLNWKRKENVSQYPYNPGIELDLHHRANLLCRNPNYSSRIEQSRQYQPCVLAPPRMWRVLLIKFLTLWAIFFLSN